MSKQRVTRQPARSESQWRELIERQATTGLTAQQFCERESLSYKSFLRWRSRLRRPAPSAAGEFVELTAPPEPTAAAPVAERGAGACVMELCVGPSVTVRIYAAP